MNWKTIFIAIALFFSSTAYAQITLDWETDAQGKYIYSNGLITGEIVYKHFVVTSGSGYIDMEATLGLDGSSTTTRMWVEEGIEYVAPLKFNLYGTIQVEPDEYCYTVTLDSATSSPPGMARKPATPSFNGSALISVCPVTVTFIPQTDELQVNASDGTFADHVRITWNEVPGATGYEVFRCTGLSPQLPNDEDSSCAAAIGSSSDNGFNDTGGLEEVSYWYRVKSCTDGVCSAFSEYDEGYRHDEDDHGNNCDEATSVNANSTSPGALQNWWAERYYDRYLAYDKDFFRVDLPSVGFLTVQTTGSTSTHGTLLDAECTEIVQSNDDDENNNFLINEELAAGTYYVGIRGVSYIPNPLKYGFQKLQDDTGPYQFVSSFEPTSSLPEAPPEVSASDGAYYDAILVSWSEVSLASSYKVYYSEGVTTERIFLKQTTETSTFITSNEAGVVYFLWVRSVNANGESENARFDTGYSAARTVPYAPTLTSAEPGHQGAVLNFTANHDGGFAITGYTASCGAFSQAGSSSPITVGGLTNGVEYSCSVIATNAEGDSPSSNVLSVTPIPKELIYSDGFEAKTN
jgi:hypothetical protein